MYLRAIREVELETKRRQTRAISSLALEHINTAGRRSADYRTRGDCHRNSVKGVLQREFIVGGKRTSVTKRRQKELAIFRLVFSQSFEDGRRLWSKAAQKPNSLSPRFRRKGLSLFCAMTGALKSRVSKTAEIILVIQDPLRGFLCASGSL